MFTILIGVHVVVVALARTALQSAADAAVDAAQVAGAGARASEGELAARLTLAGARASVVETRLPVVLVSPGTATVRADVFGAVYTPVLGTVHLTAAACAPSTTSPPPDSTRPPPRRADFLVIAPARVQPAAWVVRGGREGGTVLHNLREDVVTLGWGDWITEADGVEYSDGVELDRIFAERFHRTFPESARRRCRQEILRFRDRLCIGDLVVLPFKDRQPSAPLAAIGRVA